MNRYQLKSVAITRSCMSSSSFTTVGLACSGRSYRPTPRATSTGMRAVRSSAWRRHARLGPTAELRPTLVPHGSPVQRRRGRRQDGRLRLPRRIRRPLRLRRGPPPPRQGHQRRRRGRQDRHHPRPGRRRQDARAARLQPRRRQGPRRHHQHARRGAVRLDRVHCRWVGGTPGKRLPSPRLFVSYALTRVPR